MQVLVGYNFLNNKPIKTKNFDGHILLNNEPTEIEIFFSTFYSMPRGIILFYVKTVSDNWYSRFCIEHRFASKRLFLLWFYAYRQVISVTIFIITYYRFIYDYYFNIEATN